MAAASWPSAGSVSRSFSAPSTLQPPLQCRLGLLPPLLELEQRQAELAREQLGGLAAQQSQHHLALARRAPALAGRQRAQGCPVLGRRGALAWGQRGRAAPALADPRPLHCLISIVLVHAALHHAGLRSDKSLSRETGCSSRLGGAALAPHDPTDILD